MKKVRYPESRVVAALDASALDAAMAALTSAGFPGDDMLLITPDDIGNIDSPLTETGVSGFLRRLILSLGVDLAVLEHLREQVVTHGRVIVMVPVNGDDEKSQAANILNEHNAYSVNYAGTWTIERL